jgi:hypothetical protein
MPDTYYRVVANVPPMADDFAPDSAVRARRADETDEEYHGRSVWRTLRQARGTAAFLSRKRGRPHYIAAVDVPAVGPVRVEPFRGSGDHFNLIGDPEACLAQARIVGAESVD